MRPQTSSQTGLTGASLAHQFSLIPASTLTQQSSSGSAGSQGSNEKQTPQSGSGPSSGQSGPSSAQNRPSSNHETSRPSQLLRPVTSPLSSSQSQQQQQQQQSSSLRNHQSQPSSSALRPSSGQSHSHQSHSQQHSHHALQPQMTSQALNNQNGELVEAQRRAEATAASLAASAGQPYRCPDPFGYFRHHKSCDKYWACDNGTATLKICGNGLMFDDSDPKRENCAYPFSVDCGSDRTDLEAPISTPHCPRLYGLFPDTSNCRVFYSCWNGESSKYECPPGLAYDNEQRVCVWADLVDRCDQSEVSDGFVCPDATEVDQPGHYTRHAHPTDCRKFYVCIEGVARPYGCSLGTVFNVDSLQCDEPENVSGCEKYYGDMDPKLAKKLARENTQGTGSGQQQQTRSNSATSTSFSSSSGTNVQSSGSSSGNNRQSAQTRA